MITETIIALAIAGASGVAIVTRAAKEQKKKPRLVLKFKQPLKFRPTGDLVAALNASLQLSDQNSIRLTGPSLSQTYVMARRALWDHVDEGPTMTYIDRIMAGTRPTEPYWLYLQAKCSPSDILGMPACIQREMELLGPLSAWEKSTLLWDQVWRSIIKGFNLKGDPPDQEELDEISTIVVQAILSQIDPLRVANSSTEARLETIMRRVKQTINWPLCGDMEGCLDWRRKHWELVAEAAKVYEGEALIVELANITGGIIASRLRTLVVDLPTDFGEFFVNIALPAWFSGVMLAVELWGLISGDSISWTYPENIYTEEWAGEFNADLQVAQSVASDIESETE